MCAESVTERDVEMVEQDFLCELQGDLATVACYAATELDRLASGKTPTLRSVPRLIDMLQSSVVKVSEPTSPSSLVDPATAAAINGALLDYNPRLKGSLDTLTEVIDETSKMIDELQRVIDEPKEYGRKGNAKLKEMRSFFLALSRRAISCEEPMDESEQEYFTWNL